MGTGGEPKFTPILTENFDEIIGRAKSPGFTKELTSFRPGGAGLGLSPAQYRGRKWQ